MTISRIELQGQVTRAQDFTAVKQSQDNKGLIDQSNIQTQFDRNVDDKLHQVGQGERIENEGKRFDAREKGDGSYAGDGGKNRQKGEEREKEEDGKVILKGQSSFDIKI